MDILPAVSLLALETSTESCSVALLHGGRVEVRAVTAGGSHSERVLPLVSALLAEAGLKLSDLDAIAFGSGPGAFTGLRLACGVAQGLAFGAGLPVLGIGSLEALAFSCGRPRVYAAVDARMEEIYFAAYRVDGASVAEVLAPGVAAAHMAGLPEGADWFGCGSGFAVQGGALCARLGDALCGFDSAPAPEAGAVARLAAARLDRAGDPFSAQPAYVRQKVALTTAERLARGGKA